MTPLLRSRQRAEEFAALVDGRGDALRDRPAHDRRSSSWSPSLAACAAPRTSAPRPELRRRPARAADDRGRDALLTRRGRACTLPPRTRGTPRAPPRRRRGRRRVCSAARPAWPPPPRTRCPARRSTRSSGASRRAQAACTVDAGRQGPRPARPGQRPARRGRRGSLGRDSADRARRRSPATLDDVHRPGRRGRRRCCWAPTPTTSDPRRGRRRARRSPPTSLATLDGAGADRARRARSRARSRPRRRSQQIDARAAPACPTCADLPALEGARRRSCVASDVDRALRPRPAPPTLNNDHPVIAPRDAVSRAAGQRPESGSDPAPAERRHPGAGADRRHRPASSAAPALGDAASGPVGGA